MIKKDNNAISTVKTYKLLDDSYIPNLNSDYSKQLKGKIASVLLRGDTVFVIVKRDHDNLYNSISGDLITHGHDSYFNGNEMWAENSLTIPELAIPSNINPNTTDLNRYIGRSVIVREETGVAVFAEIYSVPEPLTTIPQKLFKIIREKAGETNIFDPAALSLWKSFGIAQEQIEGLRDLVYRQEDMEGKRITFEGEGLWGADTDEVRNGEYRIKPGPLIRGLNKLGMKTNLCHEPTRVFSAK